VQPFASSTADGAARKAEGDAPAQRAPVAVGLQGRVVDAAHGAPLAGVVIEHRFAGSVEHRASSGPDGVFAFAPGVPASGSLEASKAGWRFRPSSQRLKRRKAGEEILFVGEAIVAAPVHGRLFDASTGEPVPAFRFTLGGRGPDDDEELVSDAEGRFTSRAAFEQGEVQVELTELGWSRSTVIQHRVQDGQAEVQEIGIAVGPTLFFELAGAPDDVGNLTAELVDRGAPVLRAWSRALAHGWDGWVDDLEPPSEVSAYGRRSGISAELRTDGGAVWARFPPPDPGQVRPGPEGYAVLVSDLEHGLGGVGFARGLLGIQEDPIEIRIESLLTLAGSVSTHEGDPVCGAFVTLEGGSRASRLACITDEEGGFAFLAPPGGYELRAESPFGALERSVVLRNESASLDLQLGPVETLEVAGTLLIPPGSPVLGPELELRSIADTTLRFGAVVEMDKTRGLLIAYRKQPDGSLRGTFRFPRVPAGSYELLAPAPAGCAWEPSVTRIERSVTDLALVLRSDLPRVRLCFDVRDQDGNALEASFGGYIEEGITEVNWQQNDSLAVPPGSTVHWIVLAEGCVPQQGVCRVESAEEQTVAVELERGKGFFLRTFDPWGEGVAGAEILVDGAPAGRTNAFGFATLAFEAEPRSIEGRKPGWACVDSLLELDDQHAVLYLAPED